MSRLMLNIRDPELRATPLRGPAGEYDVEDLRFAVRELACQAVYTVRFTREHRE